VLALAEGAFPRATWVWSKATLAALLILAALVGGAGALVLGKADSPPTPAEAKAEGIAPQKPPALASEPQRLDADGDPLPPGARARLGTARFRHGGMIQSLAYSPDGKLLASGGAQGAISLWDATTGRLVRRLVGHERDCQRVVFAPDGKLLASLGWEEEVIILWDPAAGQEVRRLPGHPGQKGVRGQTNAVTFTPDGKHLASTGLDGTTLLWDVATGQLVRQLPGVDPSPGAVAFSPDGKLLAQGGDGMVYLWDTATDKEVRRLRPPGAGGTGVLA
jgi:glucose/arabinose dehydrogenase